MSKETWVASSHLVRLWCKGGIFFSADIRGSKEKGSREELQWFFHTKCSTKPTQRKPALVTSSWPH